MLLSCLKRNEQISKEVALIVRSCNDLVAVEARYHASCRIKFMNPEKHFILEKKMRISLLDGQLRTKSCEWIEHEVECYAVKELHQKMIHIADSPTVYATKWLKKKVDREIWWSRLFCRNERKVWRCLLKKFSWFKCEQLVLWDKRKGLSKRVGKNN